MIIDNRINEEESTIYWIVDIAPYYGETAFGQVTEGKWSFIEYVDEATWLADLATLGIEVPE